MAIWACREDWSATEIAMPPDTPHHPTGPAVPEPPAAGPRVPSWRPEAWTGVVVRLVSTEAAGGVAMTAAVVVALVWSNLGGSYGAVWSHPLHWFAAPGLGTVRGWVNNALMTLFFLGVGLEIGRERASGSLQGARNAVLPVVAATGGMIGAALAYLATVAATGTWSVARGWGVPMATDVAFTLGAMALLGRRVPPALRVFVLALAVADDVGSVVVLAFVSSTHLRPWALGAALAVLVLTVLLRRRVPVAWWPYLLALAAEWFLLAEAGVDPTLAGAFVGIAVPCAAAGRPSASGRLERPVAPLSIIGVLPVFVLANAGVAFAGFVLGHGARGVLIGILVARLVGKTGGIALAAALVVRFSILELPSGVHWRQLVGAAALCGMGFTVPLLFAASAFAGETSLLDASRLGLLGGTVLALGLGGTVLTRTAEPHR
ncbi:MAG: Na+/H+ antiporter NhaA [Acidimicrobiales bacterium]